MLTAQFEVSLDKFSKMYFGILSQIKYEGSILFPVEDGYEVVIRIIHLRVTILHTEKDC